MIKRDFTNTYDSSILRLSHGSFNSPSSFISFFFSFKPLNPTNSILLRSNILHIMIKHKLMESCMYEIVHGLLCNCLFFIIFLTTYVRTMIYYSPSSVAFDIFRFKHKQVEENIHNTDNLAKEFGCYMCLTFLRIFFSSKSAFGTVQR